MFNAAMNGHKDVVELLLVSKADVNAKDKSSNTRLHYALKSERENVAKMLRQHGGNEWIGHGAYEII